MIRSRFRWEVPVLLFVWFFVTAGIRPLTGPDEGRYIGVALEMLHSNDGWVPRLDGLPFFHKPPLFYWIGAAAMWAFGAVEWAGRLPSVLGATLGAASLYLYLRRWSTESLARRSAVIVATLPFFHVGAQFANLDMLVAGCIAATVLATAHTALLREQALPGALAWSAASFALAALGVLAKGLIGVVLPAVIFLAWCVATRRPRQALLLLSPPGWAVLLLVAMPWFVVMQLRYPMFFDYFVVTQHFRRFAETGFNNAHPFWFYLPVIAGLSLPWSGWVFVGAWRGSRGRQGPRKLSDTDWLMLLWMAGIVVFFSLPHSKLVGYVLPALPPLAYGIARCLPPSGRAMRWTAGAAAVICVACVVLAGHYGASPAAGLRLPPGQVPAPGDKVVMLDDYLYELPFYWHLRQPVYVAADWSPAVARAHDNWRKEFYDAAQFATADARAVLIAPADIGRLGCSPGAVWLVAAAGSALARPWTAGAPPLVNHAGMAVWRIAPACDRAAP